MVKGDERLEERYRPTSTSLEDTVTCAENREMTEHKQEEEGK